MATGLQIKLPNKLAKQHNEKLVGGEWYVRVFGAKIVETVIEEYGPLETSVWVPDDADIVTISPEEGDQYVDAVQGSRSSRSLAGDQRRTRKSVRKILIARVSTSDRSPSYSRAQLEQFYFNMNGYSVARQYSLCSSGWIYFTGYNFPHSAVVEVHVPGKAGSFDSHALLGAALPILQAQLQVQSITSVTDHVAFIFPSGLQGGAWYGSGVVGSYRSVFNDKNGGIPNSVMHEIGHNLGLNHAGMGSEVYLDETDVMGYGGNQQFGPSKCFNGKHIWDLGWFTDRTVTVNPFSHTIVHLACFVDYKKTVRGQYVVINVIGSFYLAFNQAKGVNAGTGAVPNKVTIVEPGSYTRRVGAISPSTAAFEVANYEGSSKTLIIKVCRYMRPWNGIQLAVVSIGMNHANCS